MRTIRGQGCLTFRSLAIFAAFIASHSNALPHSNAVLQFSAGLAPDKTAKQHTTSQSVQSGGGPPAPKSVCHICQDWPQASFHWGLCDAHGSIRLPSRNNLGGLGPIKEDPHEIRYDNVATFKGVDMDLVVTNMTEYAPYNIYRNVPHDKTNGVAVHGCFGVINLAGDAFVKLKFGFKPHGGEDFMQFDVLDKFVFSVWDLDHSSNDHQERVALDSRQLDGTIAHEMFMDVVENLEFGGSVIKEWASKDTGTGSDNPVNPMHWVNKSVEAQYKGISSWDVVFESMGGKRGRNFLFHGCRSCPPVRSEMPPMNPHSLSEANAF